MSALEEPSPKTTRPLAPSCHSAAPASRLLDSDRQLLPRTPLWSVRSLVLTARVRIVPPSPRFEEPPVSSRMVRHEKMEERLRMPSTVSATPASSSSSTRHFSHANPTPCGARQSHAPCLFFYDLARCLRTVSLERWFNPTFLRSVRTRMRSTTPPAARRPW